MLTFDAERHEYQEGGVVLPSVTQILRAVGLIDTRFMHQSATHRGTRVHEATAELDRGEKAPADFDRSLGGYIVGWQVWKALEAVEVLEVEKVVGSTELGYAGTCDRVVRIDGELWALDLKTGAPRSWHRLQLAAYALALGFPCRRMAVYLDGACSFRAKEFARPTDFEEWKALVALARHFHALRGQRLLV